MKRLIPILASFSLIAALSSCEKDEIIQTARQESAITVDPYTPVVDDYPEDKVRSATDGSGVGEEEGNGVFSINANNGVRTATDGGINANFENSTVDANNGVRSTSDGGLRPTPDANNGVRSTSDGGLRPTPDANNGVRTATDGGINANFENSTIDANNGVRSTSDGGLRPTPDANRGSRTINNTGLNGSGSATIDSDATLIDG